MTVWAKWPKTAWKLQNQHVGGEVVGSTWGTSQFFRLVGEYPMPCPSRTASPH